METSSSGSSQGSILGPLSLTIYISDLPNELKSNAKLFADATSLFTIVKDKNESSNTLNNDLSLIWKWAFSWKMLLIQILVNQLTKYYFQEKEKVQIHPTINLNNIQVEWTSYQNKNTSVSYSIITLISGNILILLSWK